MEAVPAAVVAQAGQAQKIREGSVFCFKTTELKVYPQNMQKSSFGGFKPVFDMLGGPYFICSPSFSFRNCKGTTEGMMLEP